MEGERRNRGERRGGRGESEMNTSCGWSKVIGEERTTKVTNPAVLEVAELD